MVVVIEKCLEVKYKTMQAVYRAKTRGTEMPSKQTKVVHQILHLIACFDKEKMRVTLSRASWSIDPMKKKSNWFRFSTHPKIYPKTYLTLYKMHFFLQNILKNHPVLCKLKIIFEG